MRSITRKNFLAAAGATAAVAGLAACSSETTDETEDDATEGVEEAASDEDPLAAPDASAYPIDPDDDTVEAVYTSETSRKDGWTKYTQDGAPTIGVTDTAKVIQVNGYAFRDMNGNGKLDLWEDWRQPAEDRAEALAEELTIDEIVPLMWHPTFGGTGELSDDTLSYVEQGMRVGLSRANVTEDNYVEAITWVNAMEAACEATDQGIPYMNSTDPQNYNNIPDPHCLATTFDYDLWKKAGMYNSRTWRSVGYHVDLGPQVDLCSNPIWSRYSGSVTGDPMVNRDFTRAYAGGMQSTYADTTGADDQGWGTDSVACMLKHYVGGGAAEGGRNDHDDAGKYDVFPGENYNAHLIPFLDGGLNLDSETGQMAAVMPNYGIAYSDDERYGEIVAGAYSKYNLSILRNAGWDGMVCTDWGVYLDGEKTWGVEDLTQPERFVKMVEAGTDQVGNDFVPDDALEAYDLMVEELGEDEAMSKFRTSARRILTVMVHVGLFDNPYSDREVALECLEDEEANEFGQDARDKCVVMLKNAGNVIAEGGITGNPVCYVPQEVTSSGGSWGAWGGDSEDTEVTYSASYLFDETVANEIFTVVTDTLTTDDDGNYTEDSLTRATADDLASCEYAILQVSSPATLSGTSTDDDGNTTYTPASLQYGEYTASTAREVSLAGDTLEDGTKENRSYYGQTVAANNEDDLELVISMRENLPEDAKIILCVQGSTPQCFHEIEPYVDVILWSWSQDSPDLTTSYSRILTGEVEPSGLLPCQMPASMEEVEAQYEDVPRDMTAYTDTEGNTYDFCFGLNWSGVIDDDRVATYKVSPLTEPETTVDPDTD